MPPHSLQCTVSDPVIIKSFSSAKGNRHTGKKLCCYCILADPATQITKARGADEAQERGRGARRDVRHESAPLK